MISQQSLSTHMGKLEKELGVRLFNRTPAFSLTFAGERLRSLAGSIMDLRKEIYLESSDIASGERCRLSIGVSYTCGRAVLPRILPSFTRVHPLVEILLMEGNSSELENWLEHGMIDFMIAFAPINVKGIEKHSLCRERLFLVVPRAMSAQIFAGKDEELYRRNLVKADMKLFKDLPFIMIKRGNLSRAMFEDYLLQSGFEPNVILETENSETALALAEEGMGVTFFSELFLNMIHPAMKDPANRRTEFFPFATPETTSELMIARLSGKYHQHLADAFQEHCIRSLEGILPDEVR